MGQDLTAASPWTPVAFHIAAQAPATSWASGTARRASGHFTLGDGCRRRRTAVSDPTNKEVADLIRQIRTENIPALFGLEVFPSDVMRTIAAESGAAYIDELNDDDLPGGPRDADHGYLGLAVSNLRIMIPALGGDTSGPGRHRRISRFRRSLRRFLSPMMPALSQTPDAMNILVGRDAIMVPTPTDRLRLM